MVELTQEGSIFIRLFETIKPTKNNISQFCWSELEKKFQIIEKLLHKKLGIDIINYLKTVVFCNQEVASTTLDN